MALLSPSDFLELIMNEPELLLPYASHTVPTKAECDDRLLDENHECLRCGDPSEIVMPCAIQGRDGLGFRWLDLCHICRHEIHDLVVTSPKAIEYQPPQPEIPGHDDPSNWM